MRERTDRPDVEDGRSAKVSLQHSAAVAWLFGAAGLQQYEDACVADPAVRKFFEQSNPWALTSIAEKLLEAADRGMWSASSEALGVLRQAVLEAEGWEETR